MRARLLVAVTSLVLTGTTSGPALARPPRGSRTRPAAAAAPRPAPPRLLEVAITPGRVALSGPRAEQQFVVTGRFSDGLERDVTPLARFYSTNPAQLPVQADGLLVAAGNGAGVVRARIGSLEASAPVQAARINPDEPRSFLNDVIPVLTRAGCNQGACHGAQLGKGGLKLSLLGYDPDADFRALVRDAKQRRLVRSQPEGSLLLRKPVLDVPHAGGMRFTRNSLEYQILGEWIAGGAPGPRSGEPEIRSVEVAPGERVARLSTEGEKSIAVQIPEVGGRLRSVELPQAQRLVATARRADGTSEDVTRKSQFNSLNDALAPVDPDGRVRLLARGQTHVMVRYRGKATVARIVVPFGSTVGAAAPIPVRTVVDEHTNRKWAQMGLRPSEPCTDAEYLRRVFLDVLGILPTPEEVRAFLAECAKETGGAPRNVAVEARRRLVDRVLERPEYVDYWTLKWGDILRNDRGRLGEQGMWSFHNWLRAAFRENKRADQMARELVTAQGSTFTTGPANYFRVARDAADQAETTSQVFLGVRLACAKCHHHPFEKWSQDDYWQMAAFFGRVALKGSQEFGLFGGEQVVYLRPAAEVRNPRTGRVMQPTPLDGAPLADPVDQRRALAAWITAPDNPFFARNWVNRYWSYLMGRGIVDPVDDLRVTNPASNPELLDALSGAFVKSGFDLKHLLRLVLNSGTYQLSSVPTRENRADEMFFTRYTVKRMGAEELLDAICFATGTPEKFQNLPAGFRAVQLPDPGFQSYFLDTFGRPERQIACECERTAEPNMAQALHLMNSDFVQNKLGHAQGRLTRLLAAPRADVEILEELYLVTFSRLPTPAEREKAMRVVTQAPSRKEGWEDLLWALMNSREFIFKH